MLDGIPSKIEQKKKHAFWWIGFEGTSYKRAYNLASLPVPLFLVLLDDIRIFISRYQF